MIFFCIKNSPNLFAAGMRQRSLQILKFQDRLPETGRRFCYGIRAFPFGKAFSAEVEREGSDIAELVVAYPMSSHKQHGFVVGRSRLPSFVAVADDVQGEPLHVPQ